MGLIWFWVFEKNHQTQLDLQVSKPAGTISVQVFTGSEPASESRFSFIHSEPTEPNMSLSDSYHGDQLSIIHLSGIRWLVKWPMRVSVFPHLDPGSVCWVSNKGEPRPDPAEPLNTSSSTAVSLLASVSRLSGGDVTFSVSCRRAAAARGQDRIQLSSVAEKVSFSPEVWKLWRILWSPLTSSSAPAPPLGSANQRAGNSSSCIKIYTAALPAAISRTAGIIFWWFTIF